MQTQSSADDENATDPLDPTDPTDPDFPNDPFIQGKLGIGSKFTYEVIEIITDRPWAEYTNDDSGGETNVYNPYAGYEVEVIGQCDTYYVILMKEIINFSNSFCACDDTCECWDDCADYAEYCECECAAATESFCRVAMIHKETGALRYSEDAGTDSYDGISLVRSEWHMIYGVQANAERRLADTNTSIIFSSSPEDTIPYKIGMRLYSMSADGIELFSEAVWFGLIGMELVEPEDEYTPSEDIGKGYIYRYETYQTYDGGYTRSYEISVMYVAGDCYHECDNEWCWIEKGQGLKAFFTRAEHDDGKVEMRYVLLRDHTDFIYFHTGGDISEHEMTDTGTFTKPTGEEVACDIWSLDDPYGMTNAYIGQEDGFMYLKEYISEYFEYGHRIYLIGYLP